MRNKEVDVHDFNNVSATVALRLDRNAVDKITNCVENGQMDVDSSHFRILVQPGIEGVTLTFYDSQDMDDPWEKRADLIEALERQVANYLAYLARLEKGLRADGYEGQFEVTVESHDISLSYPPPRDEVGAAKLAVGDAKKMYKASVTRYRAAVNPTGQEFDDAQVRFSEYMDVEHILDYEESVLNEIVERREEAEEEPESGQAAGA
jgi:hypothetical protein